MDFGLTNIEINKPIRHVRKILPDQTLKTLFKCLLYIIKITIK